MVLRRAQVAVALLLFAAFAARAVAGEPPKGFTQVKGGLRSPAGLLYKQGNGHDVLGGLYTHAFDMPAWRIHGVFRGPPLRVIDEAWLKAKQGGRGVTTWAKGRMHFVEVDMGHPVGFLGGRLGKELGNPELNHVRLILDEYGRLVKAYPDRSFLERHRVPTKTDTKLPAVVKAPIPVVRQLVSQGTPREQAARLAQHAMLGLPSKAGKDPHDYLLVRDRYVLSYNKDRKVMNWASWRLGKEHFGKASKQDDFRGDDDIPVEWGRAEDADYSQSGWTRGHIVPAGESTGDVAMNSSTFLMTNIVPQAANVNAGPWNKMENYYRDLVRFEGKEVHVMAGTIWSGPIRTIGNGVHVPTATWKVVVVLDRGQTLADIGPKTRVIAAIMPNSNDISVNAKWAPFRTSVADIEKKTGLSLFAHLDPTIAEILRGKVDREAIPDGDHPMWRELQRQQSRAAGGRR